MWSVSVHKLRSYQAVFSENRKSLFLGRCLLIQKYFYAVYYYARNGDYSKGYWNQKRKLRVTTHFLEIIKKQ